eukprot:XP_765456.1 hypothetical protein [Theileria parva strain Muguga]
MDPDDGGSDDGDPGDNPPPQQPAEGEQGDPSDGLDCLYPYKCRPHKRNPDGTVLLSVDAYYWTRNAHLNYIRYKDDNGVLHTEISPQSGCVIELINYGDRNLWTVEDNDYAVKIDIVPVDGPRRTAVITLQSGAKIVFHKGGKRSRWKRKPSDYVHTEKQKSDVFDPKEVYILDDESTSTSEPEELEAQIERVEVGTDSEDEGDNPTEEEEGDISQDPRCSSFKCKPHPKAPDGTTLLTIDTFHWTRNRHVRYTRYEDDDNITHHEIQSNDGFGFEFIHHGDRELWKLDGEDYAVNVDIFPVQTVEKSIVITLKSGVKITFYKGGKRSKWKRKHTDDGKGTD